jgi:predicted PurR-regulated permease PerM
MAARASADLRMRTPDPPPAAGDRSPARRATSRDRRLTLNVSWATLLKIVAAIALVWLARELAWLVMLLVIAIIIAVGLAPVVLWLERRRWPRWLAATAAVSIILAAIIGFFALTWSSLSSQSGDLGARLTEVEQDLQSRLPQPLLELLNQSGNVQPLVVGGLSTMARSLLSFTVAFALAWILVLYLLIEGELTYAWVRGFVPAQLKARFDQTARQAREAASGYVIGNIVTSICAGAYVLAWLLLLHVPAALLLAMLAFLFDFVPVLGFFFACAPAVAMASTISPILGLSMIPIYLAYHFIENYLIGPRVYGARLCLSNVAVLLAFAVGAELGGVAGALIALPLAAVYPAVERLWLRQSVGDAVVTEHERLRANAP